MKAHRRLLRNLLRVVACAKHVRAPSPQGLEPLPSLVEPWHPGARLRTGDGDDELGNLHQFGRDIGMWAIGIDYLAPRGGTRFSGDYGHGRDVEYPWPSPRCSKVERKYRPVGAADDVRRVRVSVDQHLGQSGQRGLRIMSVMPPRREGSVQFGGARMGRAGRWDQPCQWHRLYGGTVVGFTQPPSSLA